MAIAHRVFADAVEDDYLKISPIPQRRTKRKGRKSDNRLTQGRALTYEQAQLLLGQCESDPEEERDSNPDLRLVILIGLLAGLRRGEIFALHYDDIDFDKDVIQICRNLSWCYGKHYDIGRGQPRFVLTDPKSKESARTVDLSPTLKSDLRLRYMQAEDKHGLIFQSRNKKPLDPKNVYNRWFKDSR